MVVRENRYLQRIRRLLSYIDCNAFFVLLAWLFGTVIGASILLLSPTPLWVRMIISLGIVLTGFVLLIRALSKNTIALWLVMIASTFLVIGFSFYFKMDRDYSAYMINTSYLISNGSFFSDTDYFQWGTYITNGVQTPSFLFGYSAYLVPFVTILGNVGFLVGNIFLLGISLLTLLEILKYCDDSPVTYKYLILFFLFNPVVIWLYTYSYSETLFLPLVWGAIVLFLKGKHLISWKILLLSYMAICFTFSVRVEALGLMASFALAIHILFIRWRIGWKRYLIAFCVAGVCTIISILMVSNISGNYVREQYADAITTIDVTDTENQRGDFLIRQQLIFLSFGTYLIMIPFIWALASSHVSKNRQIYWILLLCIPFALYLYNPRITRDFLWFMRRYITVIIPFTLVLGSIALSKIKLTHPKLTSALIGIYVLAQIFLISHVVSHKIDQRQYYSALNSFMEDTLTDPTLSSLSVIGDFSQANEASRIIPYWVYNQSNLSYKTISIKDLDNESIQDSYFIYTSEIQHPNLFLIGVFTEDIETRNSQWDPRLGLLAPVDQVIWLYIYQGIE